MTPKHKKFTIGKKVKFINGVDKFIVVDNTIVQKEGIDFITVRRERQLRTNLISVDNLELAPDQK